jgi:hypothetical protein
MLATIVVLACSLSEDEIIPEMSHAEVCSKTLHSLDIH